MTAETQLNTGMEVEPDTLDHRILDAFHNYNKRNVDDNNKLNKTNDSFMVIDAFQRGNNYDNSPKTGNVEREFEIYSEPEPHEQLLVLTDDVTAALLLPEVQLGPALDCSNFEDYDEFNLCLNSMINDDDNDVSDLSLSAVIADSLPTQVE